MKTALVVLSSGIGNVIRWTPMIRVLVEQGYVVDVWLAAPDYPDVASLLNGSPFIRDVSTFGFSTAYDVAVVTHWVPKAAREQILAARTIECPADFWIKHGDRGAVVWCAVQLGYVERIPAPFVETSGRRFDLLPGTIAIHAGRKKGWDQKQWSGFGDLLERLGDVVIVGADRDCTLVDLDPDGRDQHSALDFVGKLSLADTVALLKECVALISTDSGLSHVAAALPILSFPIYGITRPQREAFALPHVFPIENRKACASGCSSIRYNAPECPGRRACLTTLTADTVLEKVRPVIDLFLEVEAHNAARRR